MSDLVHFSAGSHRAMNPGSNLVDLEAERRARLRAGLGTDLRFVRTAKRAGRTDAESGRRHPLPALGRDGPDAA